MISIYKLKAILKSQVFFTGIIVLSLGLVFPQAIFAQDESSKSSTTMETEGIDGYRDKDDRSPRLRVRVDVNRQGNVVGADIFVSAYVANSKYDEYPITYEFYLNRRLFSKQIVSKGLPGPVGINVGSDVASIPFNYTVVASVLTPNGRPFTTVAEGVAYFQDYTKKLDCTLTMEDEEGNTSSEYVENDVETSQLSNNSFSLTMDTKAVADEGKVNLTTVVYVDENDNASATLTIVKDENVTTRQVVAANGTVTRSSTNDELSGFSLITDDGYTKLVCS